MGKTQFLSESSDPQSYRRQNFWIIVSQRMKSYDVVRHDTLMWMTNLTNSL